jgi:hypothetical protein
MTKMARFLLASSRKRRCRTAAAALWLLRLLRDVESDEMDHNSDLLDGFDEGEKAVPRHIYNAVEEDYISNEFALSVLDSAIDDIEFAY